MRRNIDGILEQIGWNVIDETKKVMSIICDTKRMHQFIKKNISGFFTQETSQMHSESVNSLRRQIGWGIEKEKNTKVHIHEEEWVSHVFCKEMSC